MMHSCALFCIPEHYGGTIPDLDARRAARSYSHHMRQYALECVRMQKNTPECTKLWDHTSKEKYSRHHARHMRQNAQECTRMRDNAFECTGLWNHTYLHKRSRADSRPNSHVDATDMGWTGCGRAHGAPMCHYMSSKSSSDSSPSPSSSTVSSVGWMRVPATMLRGRCARKVRLGTFSRRVSR